MFNWKDTRSRESGLGNREEYNRKLHQESNKLKYLSIKKNNGQNVLIPINDIGFNSTA